MRVIVTGGRNYGDGDRVFAVLDEIRTSSEPGTEIVVVHGDCPGGADSFASQWCRGKLGVVEERHAADWPKNGRAAGPIRNSEMAARGADICLVFPGGRGTADMASKARRAGITVEVQTRRT